MIDVNKLKIYSLAREIVGDVYEISKKFPIEEKYGIVSQMKRAAVSIGANIAEGAGRGTKRDFHRFLFIALGSLNETNYYLDLSVGNGFILGEAVVAISDKLDKLRRMIILFINNSRTHTRRPSAP